MEEQAKTTKCQCRHEYKVIGENDHVIESMCECGDTIAERKDEFGRIEK